MILLIASGCATLVFGAAVLVLKNNKRKNDEEAKAESETVVVEEEELDKTKYPGGHLTIYFGSQTGTAESFSKDLGREGEEYGFKTHVVDLEETEGKIVESVLNKHRQDDDGKNRAVFVIATYGEGEPTDNSSDFVNFIKGELGFQEGEGGAVEGEEKKSEETDTVINSSLFQNLEFSVFGLGDKSYENFNNMSKFFDASLDKLGGTRVVPIGLGNDDDDLEGDFEEWKDKHFWPAMKAKYVGADAALGEETKSDEKEKLPDCDFAVEYLNGPTPAADISMDQVHLSSKHYFNAADCPVVLKRELRSAADEGSTLHVEVDISSNDNIQYQTADNLAILPVNRDENVEQIAAALRYDLGAYFKLGPAKGKEKKYAAPFPTPCSVKECLARYCDLSGPPRRSDLKLLAAYAKDAISQKALLRLASKEGRGEYREKILDAKMGMVDIISRLCPSIEMPLEHFISVCPRLQPRYYTISSSSTVHPKAIHATVSVLKEEGKEGSESVFRGVCSNYLADLIDNGNVRVFVRDSTFRLPSDVTKPIIMIGPGTGIAPMRALLQERSHQKTSQNLPVGSNILYFGCKKRDLDFIYSDELNAYEKDGILSQMHVAFSREQDQKVYVQHLLAKNGEDTWRLIEEEGAYIYVCGGVKMGNDVSEALRKIIGNYGDRTTGDAKKYLEDMASNGRFVQELWA